MSVIDHFEPETVSTHTRALPFVYASELDISLVLAVTPVFITRGDLFFFRHPVTADWVPGDTTGALILS